MQKARVLFPYKTAQYLAEITGRPPRTVEYWLSKDRLPAEAIGALIQSEHGYQFVEAIVDAARPAWWRKVRRALALADEKEQQLRDAQNAAAELAAALTRAQAASSLFAEGLDREEAAHIRPAPNAPRILGRSLASAAKGR